MARRPAVGGRPSKGDRKDIKTRVQRVVAEDVEARADAAHQYVSDYVAALIDLGLRYSNQLPLEFQPKEVLSESA